MTAHDLHLLGGRRIRLVRQAEASECGLACLAMIAGFHGLDIDLASLRRAAPVSERGMTLKGLMAVADQLGLSPRAVKAPLAALGELHLPAVLHWDMNHFVVLERAAARGVVIHDPASGSRTLTLEEASKHFTGVALELRPAADFQPADRRVRLRLWDLWTRITGLKRTLTQVLILSAVLQAFVLASPYYMQVAIDSALPALDGDLLLVLALGFGLFTLINAGATALRALVLLQVGAGLGYQIAANVARRLFRLPVAYFERRHVGEVLSRFQSIQPIRDALTQGVAAALVDGVMAALTLVLMFLYSPTLALVVLAAFGIYGAVRVVTFAVERQRREDAIRNAAREQSVMIESLRGIVTLRLFGRETERHAMWQNRLAEAAGASLSQGRLSVWQTSANTLVFGLENIVCVYLAIRMAMSGGFSVGMIFAFMAYKQQFVQKAAALIDQAIAFRMLGLHLERLADIALQEEDQGFDVESGGFTLQGGLDVRQVSCRYASGEPLILDRLDLTVEPGEHVAITGPSGGGKSTLVKILLGLVRPDEGEVLADGWPLGRFGLQNYRRQVAAVLQEDQLFAGSILDNVTFFDAEPDIERAMEACRLAAIHDEIMLMPMRYETLVGDMGQAMSGGQKQRVLLARALYKQPRILVMDEGTAHLDAAAEAVVNRSIAALGVTRIVIAHRLETLRNADRVLVLARGRLHEVDRSALDPGPQPALQPA